MTNDRQTLGEAREALIAKGLIWIRATRRFQRLINIGSLLGVILLGIGSSLSGDLIPPGYGLTVKGLVVGVGALLGFAGGIVAMVLQDEAPELLKSATDLGRDAQAFLDERDQLLAELAENDILDARRLALLDANRLMRETLEQALATSNSSQAETIEDMLDAALHEITHSIGFEPTEAWAISIFVVEGDQLVRMTARRANRLGEKQDGRSWAANEGFVGTAWSHKRDVIIDDGTKTDILEAYPILPGNGRDYDAERYRSIAAIPVRIGHPATIWGVVAVSTDRAGRFRRDPENYQVQAVDTVRLIARMIALMAAAFTRPSS